MKKVLSIVAVAGVAMLASCGNAEELKRIADSLKQDSINRVEKENRMRDSMRQDSQMKADQAAADAKRMADSLREDSIKNAGNKKK